MGAFPAILAALSILYCPAASAQTGAIEQNFAASLTALPTENPAVSGAFYVPVFSSVSMSQRRLRADFRSRSASETRPLIPKRIAYFDTSGKMVESHLKSPVALKPFATIEVFIAANDVRGGTGANFVVNWAATGEIAEPAVEALVVGGGGAGHYAFISQGPPIRIIKNQPART
jgi:Protein of unknown function (DUF3124)